MKNSYKLIIAKITTKKAAVKICGMRKVNEKTNKNSKVD